jgi:pentatricopeptide repeat protein
MADLALMSWLQRNKRYRTVLRVAEEMRQRGVKVVDGFDADDAEFQAVLVRVDVGVWMDGWVWLAEMSCSAVVVVGRSERREVKSVWLDVGRRNEQRSTIRSNWRVCGRYCFDASA